MNGARDYATLFYGKHQFGRLVLIGGSHARGKTFHIFVVPEGEQIVERSWPSRESVEVYGVVGGQPGWTEYYGWLHRGPWEEDFAKIVEKRRQEIAIAKSARDAADAAALESAKQRTASLLATYQPQGESHAEG